LSPSAKTRTASDPTELEATEFTITTPADERFRELARRVEEQSRTVQDLRDFKVGFEAAEREKGKWEGRFYTVLGVALLVIGILVGILVTPHL
jgi:hypothetical protein